MAPGKGSNTHLDIAGLLDELRAIARSGMHYAANHHDLARFTRLNEIMCSFYALLTGMESAHADKLFSRELGIITPKVGVDVALFDEKGCILLHKRSDDLSWSLPGGWVDPGESVEGAALREVLEETGLHVTIDRLVGVYSRPAKLPSDPHGSCHVLYICTSVGGEMALSEESVDIGFFQPGEVSEWHRDHRERAMDAVAVLKA